MDAKKLLTIIREISDDIRADLIVEGARLLLEVRRLTGEILFNLEITGDSERDRLSEKLIEIFIDDNRKLVEQGQPVAHIEDLLSHHDHGPKVDHEDLFPFAPGFPPPLHTMTQEEISEVRCHVVEILLLRGYLGQELQNKLCLIMGCDIDIDTIEADIAGITAMAKRFCQLDSDLLRYLHLRQLSAMQREALKTGQLIPALKILQTRCHLDGTVDYMKDQAGKLSSGQPIVNRKHQGISGPDMSKLPSYGSNKLH